MGDSPESSDHRPQKSNSIMTTSSLTGAMDPQLSPHFRHSNSPSPKGDKLYDMDTQSGSVWGSPMTVSTHTTYTEAPESGHRDVPYHTISQSASMRSAAGTYTQYQDYNSSSYKNPSPESLPPPPPSPAFLSHPYAEQLSYNESRGVPVNLSRHGTHYNGVVTPVLLSPSPARSQTVSAAEEKLENEIGQLRKKVRDLELINESARLRVSELEHQLVIDHNRASTPPTSATGGPSPISTPLHQSDAFKASWKMRTDARIRRFCSLNRAGNALCAWHDSRRERRAYPPRMAPTGHLNCGCTYEEALFEESLARHNVGSYHPGENVRMDPALRNPLLKLLHARYGYRDGDFERDPDTGEWVQGEGAAYWESRAGVSNRKPRGEYDRR